LRNIVAKAYCFICRPAYAACIHLSRQQTLAAVLRTLLSVICAKKRCLFTVFVHFVQKTVSF